MYFRLAWRNIWRNPRRTGVIITAVCIGVWSMIFLGALSRGVGDQMVKNGISTLTGHLQVHKKGFRREPVIENSMTEQAKVEDALKAVLPIGSRWAERIRVYAIVSNARHTRGITLVGIDPASEAAVSFIGQAVTEGRYLDSGDWHGIIAGKALVDEFETRLGHKLVLMSQAADREIASRAFRIKGIFRAEVEVTEKQFAFITLKAAREMLKQKDGTSEISVMLPERGAAERVAKALKGRLPQGSYEVNTWKELLPIVAAVLRIYDFFVFVWFIIVFIAMGFGIVNTMLIVVFERIREFGLVKALGMKPLGIVKEVLAESFLLMVLGLIVGNGLSLLSVWALSDTGIDLSALAGGAEYLGMPHVIYPALFIKDIINANLVVVVLGLLVSLYPAIKAARFTPVRAMAHT